MRFVIKFFLIPIIGIWFMQWLFTQGILDVKVHPDKLEKAGKKYINTMGEGVRQGFMGIDSSNYRLAKEDVKNGTDDETDYGKLHDELKALTQRSLELRQKLLEHYATSNKNKK